MYRLCVNRSFIAQHFLTVPNCGPENVLHSHKYGVDVIVEASDLDENGYVVDIVALEAEMDRLVMRYKDVTLNDQDEFSGLNPSIEHFARIWSESMPDSLFGDSWKSVTVTIYEDDIAWVSYRRAA